MKRIIVCIALICYVSTIFYSQDKIITAPIGDLLETNDGDTIYVVPNNKCPYPILGFDSLTNYYENVLRSKLSNYNHNERIIVEFIVEKDGTLSHVRTFKSNCSHDVDSIISNTILSPVFEWAPGLQDSIPVRVYQRLTFRNI